MMKPRFFYNKLKIRNLLNFEFEFFSLSFIPGDNTTSILHRFKPITTEEEVGDGKKEN